MLFNNLISHFRSSAKRGKPKKNSVMPDIIELAADTEDQAVGAITVAVAVVKKFFTRWSTTGRKNSRKRSSEAAPGLKGSEEARDGRITRLTRITPLKYYAAGSIVLILGLAAAAQYLAMFQLWQFMLLLLVLMLITATPACYHIIIRKTRASSAYTRDGLLTWAASHRWLKYILIFITAAFTLFFMLIQLPALGGMEWVFMALLCPALYAIYRCLMRIFAKEVRHEWLVAPLSLGVASLAAAIIIAIAYIVCAIAFTDTPAYATFSAAVAAQGSVLERSPSALIGSAAALSNLFQGARDYAIGRLGGFLPLLALLLSSISYAVIFFDVSLMLSFLLIPPRELKRILLPLQTDSALPPLPRKTLIAATASLLFIGFICCYGINGLELLCTGYRPGIMAARDSAVGMAQDAISGNALYTTKEKVQKVKDDAIEYGVKKGKDIAYKQVITTAKKVATTAGVIASPAAVGAVIGSAVPVVGTAVGALVGAGVGVVCNAGLWLFGADDDD